MRTWAEIDLTALEHNYRTLRAMLPRECRFLGLCKANAYGHGAAVIGHTLERLGADMLAVACVSEAEELRQSGVKLPILCLGETPEELIPLLLELDVTQMVEDLETGRRLSAAAQRAGRTLRVHVKLDTGMSRLGFLWEAGREEETADEIARLCRLPGLEAEGLFTHFADAAGARPILWPSLTAFWPPGRRWRSGGSPSKSAIVPPALLCYNIPVLIWIWCGPAWCCMAGIRRRS